METLLRTLLIILIAYYALKLIIKFATPYFLKYIQKKMGQRMEGFFGNMEQPQKQQEEGKITIDKVPSKNSKNSNVVGEYVDFEEID
ncbi:hypothetical protein ULMS_20040 [Patiriisocius marinistellae]|uniref:DUF4834 domain-containing protein n=1 Tax=Patiriisocius marinistellae TaxID=2494560 RepID=A0A5J4G1P9_9FLAO|nr:DUF4834 family protein [Patiriisocius marinistellae]GEQ86496.1 hypothetical protein ULMS_20040 [Patiriisocius marinistellae]